MKSRRDLAAQVLFDMDADDLVERFFRSKAQGERAAGIESMRPAGDDARNERIGLVADAGRHRVAGDAAERFDLFGDGATYARHGEVDAGPKLLVRKARRVDEIGHGGARAGVGV